MRVGTISANLYARRTEPRPTASIDAGTTQPDKVDLSGARPLANPWPELERLGLAVAGKATGGPIGAALTQSSRQGLLTVLERVEEAGVRFEYERRFRLPWVMKKRVPFSPRQVLKHVGKAKEAVKRLHAIAPGDVDHAVQDLYDLRSLDLGYGAGAEVARPQEKPVLDALESAVSQGYKIQRGDSYYNTSEQDVAGAFNELTRARSGTYLKKGDQDWNLGSQRENLFAFEYFAGSGTDWGLADGGLAGDLRATEAAGYKIHLDGYEKSGYGAYLGLLGKGQDGALSLKREGHPGLSVKRRELGDLDRVDERLRDLSRLYDVIKPALASTGFSGYEQTWRKPLLAASPPFGLEVRAGALHELILAAGESYNKADTAVEKAGVVLTALEKDPTTPYDFGRRTLLAAEGLRLKGADGALKALKEVSETLEYRAATPTEREHLDDLFFDLLRATGSMSVAAEGLDLVRIQIGDEPESRRVALFKAIAARESGDSLKRTAEHYRSVLVHRGPEETLSETGDRFLTLLQGMSVGRFQHRAHEVFQLVQYGLKSGKYDGEGADRLVRDFLQALVVTESVEKAVASVITRETADGGIEKGEEVVTIGGVRLPRK